VERRKEAPRREREIKREASANRDRGYKQGSVFLNGGRWNGDEHNCGVAGGGWRRVERQRDRRPFLPAKIDEKIILAVNLGRTYGPSLNEAGSSLA
jgi:hypothetical protein